MFVARVTLNARDPSRLGAREAVWTLIACLRNSGQILSSEVDIYRDGFEFVVGVPERHALANRHANPDVRWALQRLGAFGVSRPRVSILGAVSEAAAADRCKTPSAYILFTHLHTHEPPVRCGDCFAPVPLYRLPGWRRSASKPVRRGQARHDAMTEASSDYQPLTFWQSEYRHCDSLWTASDVGERFGLRQLSDLTSVLSRRGLDAAGELAERACRTSQPARVLLLDAAPRPIESAGSTASLSAMQGAVEARHAVARLVRFPVRAVPFGFEHRVECPVARSDGRSMRLPWLRPLTRREGPFRIRGSVGYGVRRARSRTARNTPPVFAAGAVARWEAPPRFQRRPRRT